MGRTTLGITYIGGPTAIIEFGGARFITDPTFDDAPHEYPSGASVLRKIQSPALTSDQVGRIDAVLLSHDHHPDNLDSAGRDFLPRANAVITTIAGAERLGGNAVGLAPWQVTTITNNAGQTVKVTATPARHGPAHMDRGPVIGFVLENTQGEAIYVAGDTVFYEGVQDVAKRYHIQAAILNLGAASVKTVGPFHLTMTAEEAVETARVFPQALIVPLHFEGWEHFSESRSEIEAAFQQANLKERVVWLGAGVSSPLTFSQ